MQRLEAVAQVVALDGEALFRQLRLLHALLQRRCLHIQKLLPRVTFMQLLLPQQRKEHQIERHRRQQQKQEHRGQLDGALRDGNGIVEHQVLRHIEQHRQQRERAPALACAAQDGLERLLDPAPKQPKHQRIQHQPPEKVDEVGSLFPLPRDEKRTAV